MDLAQHPLFDRLSDAQNILMAGAGGGFDIFCGLPLYFALKKQGKNVILGNLTFSNVDSAMGERLTPEVVTVTADAEGPQGYFPERYLSAWFRTELEEEVPVYCFKKCGTLLLKRAYRAVIEAHDIDTIVLVDGGTDSLMKGDEPGLGTPHEDMLSVATASDMEGIRDSLLVCLGFGIDTFHGVCHTYFLRAVAELARQNAFLGSFSCLAEMPEVQTYLEILDDVHRQMPSRPSIVNSSIASAIEGEFGNVHRTQRTLGSELFINPLMSIYWAFDLRAVADRVMYMPELRRTTYFRDVVLLIEGFRSGLAQIEPWKEMPV